jgi:hypothetical protein
MEALLKTHASYLTKTEIQFLNAGLEFREKQKKEKTHRKQIITRISLITGIVLLLLTVFAFIQKNRADRQYIKAKVNVLAAESYLALPEDNIKAIRIAEAAYKIGIPHPSPPVKQALSAAAYSTFEHPFYTTNMQHDEKVNYANFLPDGMQIITTSSDKTAKLWDLNGDLKITLNRHQDSVTSAVFFYNETTKIILTF